MIVQQRVSLKRELTEVIKRHQGRDRAITGMELAKMLNQRDDRKIRILIRELIEGNLPIASCSSGYFIPVTYQEAQEYADSLKGRLIEDALRRRDFRRAADCHLRPATQRRLW